jgi:hypothetical protein
VIDRAISTVLDVCVCLLLVSASVLTLLAAPVDGEDPAAGTADELATTLAAGTTTVRYSGPTGTRAVHGTHAGLLATAARTNRTPATGGRFRAAVRSAVRGVLDGDDWRARVRATWRPYEGADPTAVVVGPAPPPGADVHAATTSVPSGLQPVGAEARRAAGRSGYRGVAAVVASAAVPDADERRRQAYVRRTTADLRGQYESPQAAARAVSVGLVRVTVRTWSP